MSRRRCNLDGSPVPRADAKAIANFTKFLEGRGKRCPVCHHKAKRHHSWCGVQGCSCQASRQGVEAWQAKNRLGLGPGSHA